MPPLRIILEEWDDWMAAVPMSARTIEARIHLVWLFVARTNADPLRCGWQDVAKFLRNPRLKSASSVVTYYSHLQSWFTFLLLMEYRADNPMTKLHAPSSPYREPHSISTDDLARLLSSGVYKRTRMMIALAAYEGFRVHEIAKVRGEHLQGAKLRVSGKGNVTVELDVHPYVLNLSSQFPRIGFWFPSPRDQSVPILGKSVSNVISKAMARAGVHGSAHSLRHWYGTEMLDAGNNPRAVQRNLRHASLATTQIYTRARDQARLDAIHSLPVPLHTPRSRASRA